MKPDKSNIKKDIYIIKSNNLNRSHSIFKSSSCKEFIVMHISITLNALPVLEHLTVSNSLFVSLSSASSTSTALLKCNKKKTYKPYWIFYKIKAEF